MFRASDLELEILQLLAPGRPKYGLEMVKASEKLKRGTIYVYLGRMEDKKWISSEPERAAGVAGMPRRLYRIAREGRRILDATSSARQVYETWQAQEA